MVVMVICSTLDLISVQLPISSGCGTSHNSVSLLTGADDILPYLIFTLVRTAPKHIHSNIRLVDNEMCYCVCVCGCVVGVVGGDGGVTMFCCVGLLLFKSL